MPSRRSTHLVAVVNPGSLPECGFRVGTEEQAWREGKVLMFCDAHLHTAFNNTNHRRFIVNFDVLRPEFAHREGSVCATALAAIVTQKVWQWLPFVKRSSWLTWLTYRALTWVMLLPSSLGIGSHLVYKILADD